jgi:hypothetical protein
MTERPRRVVLLIDYDNLQICASRDTPGRDLQLTPVVQLAQRYGTVILARAYAEWNLSTERLAVYKAGIEPAFAPVLRTESDRSGKSLADTVMVAEGMDMLWTLSPDVVVLATSDKDLIPLVRVAKQRGAHVVVLGSDFTAIPLREMADDHVTYRQLVTETGGRFATEAGPARQPAALPEPARRRARDRAGRDRVSTPPPVTQPSAAPRPEREPAAPPPAAPATPSAAEPVAPVTGSVGEADAQVGGRRRRRRGSRRRAERLGQLGETVSTGEGGAPEATVEEAEITPTTSAAEVAQASGGTVEAETVEAPADEFDQPAPEPAAEPAAKPVEPAEPAPAPRERRRRTRRVTAAAAEPAPSPPATPTPESAEVAGAAATPPAETAEHPPAAAPTASEAPPQSADISPAPAPAAPNGTPEAPQPAAAAPRRRRVASASRGRSRSTGR